jgi:hypothetical protein
MIMFVIPDKFNPCNHCFHDGCTDCAVQSLMNLIDKKDNKLKQIEAATLSCDSDESIVTKIQAILRGEQG